MRVRTGLPLYYLKRAHLTPIGARSNHKVLAFTPEGSSLDIPSDIVGSARNPKTISHKFADPTSSSQPRLECFRACGSFHGPAPRCSAELDAHLAKKNARL